MLDLTPLRTKHFIKEKNRVGFIIQPAGNIASRNKSDTFIAPS
jgi:hypothetical protein